ncbi:hypothetical protein P154DRAFT_582498 [Amniculicola lignicola CBS 123094]|uniref:Uncharacterized protein n=1 Tax=Amniculicola lignicola CBS 123094 TaxID=1392246 RepID=A0A6A5VXL6_9PLEO|nr:hypothetical protein P154DRAFT_582498 [Amniculicola lignicola CBS 123094]
MADDERQDSHGSCLEYSSTYHDLQCGHRVKAPKPDSCGSTCVKLSTSTPFVCQECIIDAIDLELKLDHFSLEPDEDVDMAGSEEVPFAEKVRILADRQIKLLLEPQFRGNIVSASLYYNGRLASPAPKDATPTELYYWEIEEEEAQKEAEQAERRQRHSNQETQALDEHSLGARNANETAGAKVYPPRKVTVASTVEEALKRLSLN